MNKFQRWQKGEVRPGFPTDVYNKTLDVIEDFETNGRGNRGLNPQQQTPVLITNNSGQTVPRGGVLAVTGAVYDPANFQDAYQNQIVLSGGVPTGADNESFVIMLEPVLDTNTGRCVLSGPVATFVSVSDAGHKFAKPTTTVNNLISAESGPAHIVHSENGGANNAIVNLGICCGSEATATPLCAAGQLTFTDDFAAGVGSWNASIGTVTAQAGAMRVSGNGGALTGQAHLTQDLTPATPFGSLTTSLEITDWSDDLNHETTLQVMASAGYRISVSHIRTPTTSIVRWTHFQGAVNSADVNAVLAKGDTIGIRTTGTNGGFLVIEFLHNGAVFHTADPSSIEVAQITVANWCPTSVDIFAGGGVGNTAASVDVDNFSIAFA